MGSNLSPNLNITKDLKSCTYYMLLCQTLYVTLIVKEMGNALAQIRLSSSTCTHTAQFGWQFGLQTKNVKSKGLFWYRRQNLCAAKTCTWLRDKLTKQMICRLALLLPFTDKHVKMCFFHSHCDNFKNKYFLEFHKKRKWYILVSKLHLNATSLCGLSVNHYNAAILSRLFGRIPYTAHGAFVFMLILGYS